MKTEDIEIPLLIIAGLLSIEFLGSWLGILATGTISLYTTGRIVQLIRNWNYAKEKRGEEKAKRAEEHEQYLQFKDEHELRMKLLRKQLGEKEAGEREQKEKEKGEKEKEQESKDKEKKANDKEQ